VARRTGVSVRALHHYEEIGLLAPGRSAAGHRLYGETDLSRLGQIVSLRQLGFSLEQIGDLLDRQALSAREVLELHAERLRSQIAGQQRLLQRLEALTAAIDPSPPAPVTLDQLLDTIQEIKAMETYYTPEQRETMAQRREAVGEERIRQVEEEWKTLIAEVRTQMERGSDPTSEPVLALARRWRALVAEFTGGDPGIERSLANVYRGEPELHTRHEGVPDPEVMAYMGRAQAALPR
jgi:DNA-binding transcriptional MerR regulator